MKNHIKVMIVFAVTALAFISCYKPPSQMGGQNGTVTAQTQPTTAAIPSEAPTSSMETATPLETETASVPAIKHIKQTINGKTIKLHIDMDVTEFSNKDFGVYNASPLRVDHEAWYEYFFSGIDRNELTHYYSNWGQSFLDKQEVTQELIEETFAYIQGDIHTPEKEVFYLVNTARFYYKLGNKDLTLKEKCTLKPVEKDRNDAEALSDQFMSFVAGDRLIRDSCDIAQLENGGDAVYVSKYERLIEGLPILIDEPLSGGIDETPTPIRIDCGVVYVKDGQVVFADAKIRDLALVERKPIIPVEQALSILEALVDTVDAYSPDFIEGKSSVSEFTINRFELMYYPVLIEDSKLASTYIGKNAYATYRPVWCIASGQREHSNMVFVMIIDAISGKVIG